jgi:hypothetical protein
MDLATLSSIMRTSNLPLPLKNSAMRHLVDCLGLATTALPLGPGSWSAHLIARLPWDTQAVVLASALAVVYWTGNRQDVADELERLTMAELDWLHEYRGHIVPGNPPQLRRPQGGG